MYNIKVVVTDDNGSTEKVINQLTGELAEGTISQVGDPEWNNGTATLKLETTETAEGIYIVYQIGDIDGEWLEYPEEGISGLNHEDIVYVAISDGTNVSKESNFKIKDGIEPTVTITKGTVTTKSIAVSVSSSDSQWGMPSSISYSYYIKTSSTTNYPTTASYTGTNTSYTFNKLNQTTSYDIKVTTTNKAGNVSTAKTQVVYKDNTVPSTATSYAYNYTGLTARTTYYLRVIVTDRAGNTKTSSAVTQKIDYPTVESVLEEGDWVNYVDKNGTTRKCIVLYDNSSAYGTQIITVGTVKNITYGSDNPSEAYTSHQQYPWNIDLEAKNYGNSNYSNSARCVGSVPDFKYLIDDDNNDLNKLESLNKQNIGEKYWISNYGSQMTVGWYYFNLYYVESDGTYSMVPIYEQLPDFSTRLRAFTCGLRPIFDLKETVKVTGGNGTETSPYTLGT